MLLTPKKVKTYYKNKTHNDHLWDTAVSPSAVSIILTLRSPTRLNDISAVIKKIKNANNFELVDIRRELYGTLKGNQGSPQK
jgi:hypothetical protein